MIERWVALWDRREAPESIGLVRLLVGLVVLFDLLGEAATGLVPELWLPAPAGLGIAPAPSATSLVFGLLAPTPLAVGAVWGVATLSALAVALGVALRPAAFACALATASLAHLAPNGERAIDMLLRVVLLVLGCSRADAAFSVTAWLTARRGRERAVSIPAWPRLLLTLELIWVYCSAAQNRGGDAWWPRGGFAALSRVLSDPHFALWSPGWTHAVYPVTQLATATTMAFELGSPLVLLFAYLDGHPGRGGRAGDFVRRARLRWVWLGVGVLLHLGIAATMRLGIFPFGMLALYPLLVEPGELTAWLRRCVPSAH